MLYCLLDLSCDECYVISLFDSVCELFDVSIRNVLGVVAISLVNVMDVFSVGGGALLDRPCMVFQIMCMLCL